MHRSMLSRALLIAFLLASLPHPGATRTVSIGALFRETGWSPRHLAAAATAVHRINGDPSILPGTELQLERVNIDALGALLDQGSASLLGGGHPLKQCYVGNIFERKQLENVSVIVGVGYSEDVTAIAPFLDEHQKLLLTFAAQASIFSDKKAYPNVARMCRSMRLESAALINIVKAYLNHTAIKVLSCQDAFCQSCLKEVEVQAQKLDIKIASSHSYSENLDVPVIEYSRLPNEIAAVVTSCEEASVVVLCSHKNEAMHLMRLAAVEPNYQPDSTIWVLGPWSGTSLQQKWTDFYPESTHDQSNKSSAIKPSTVLSLGIKVPRREDSDEVAAYMNHVEKNWSEFDASLVGSDVKEVTKRKEAGGEDEWVRWTIDCVYAVAHALDVTDR
jgi:hypothetical protein